MTRILLTGAGFSRNWGGWLASEAFEYLLGCAISPEVRLRLWTSKNRGGGFEETLADLQAEFSHSRDPNVGAMVDALTSALLGMFNEMDKGFYNTKFEPQNERIYQLGEFLLQFDAIFSLNQDLLLERHYLNGDIGLSPTRAWIGWQIPGVKLLEPGHQLLDPNLAMRTPMAEPFRLEPSRQPYFKLHGSSNWVREPGGRVIILGGNKAAGIAQEPLLRWYHEQFVARLQEDNCKLMVIGYSFGDRHINDAIMEAADLGRLGLFIVDPEGVDVLDKQKRIAIRSPQPLKERLDPRIVGASQRSLSSTFGHDRVEHAKLLRFLTS